MIRTMLLVAMSFSVLAAIKEPIADYSCWGSLQLECVEHMLSDGLWGPFCLYTVGPRVGILKVVGALGSA